MSRSDLASKFRPWALAGLVVSACTTLALAPAMAASGAVAAGASASTSHASPLGIGLAILAPNGGEAIQTGSVVPIQWTAPFEGATFDIHYSVDNGQSWRKIAEDLIGVAYDWTVPSLPGNKPKSKVRITAFDGGGQKLGKDVSDAAFLIEVVRLDSPNGGEVLEGNDTHSITWTTGVTIREVDSVKILFSKNGGRDWKSVATLDGNPGAYEWTVPQLPAPKTNSFVRVILRDQAGASVGKDSSNLAFAVNPDGGGGDVVLTVSNAFPESGNGDVADPLIGTESVELDGQPHTIVRIRGQVATTKHAISVYFRNADGVIHTVQHVWGLDPEAGNYEAFTQCAASSASPCDTESIHVELGTQLVTFSTLTLPDVFGGSSTSTIDGSVTY